MKKFVPILWITFLAMLAVACSSTLSTKQSSSVFSQTVEPRNVPSAVISSTSNTETPAVSTTPASTPPPTPSLTVPLNSQGLATYENEAGAFSFQYPGDWILADASSKDQILETIGQSGGGENIVKALNSLEGNVIFLFMADEPDGSTTNLSIAYMDEVRNPSERELLLAAPEIIKELSGYCVGFKAEHQGKIVKIGNRKSLEIAFSYKADDYPAVHSRQYLLYTGTRLYVATLTTTAEDPSEYVKQTKAVIGSLRFAG